MASRSVWGESGISLVVLPTGMQAEKLYEVAKEWTALRLLSPSIWIKPEEVVLAKNEPPKVFANILASTKAGQVIEKQVELFETLARQQLATVRLLVVRPVSPLTGFDQIQDEFVELLAPYLDVATPSIPPSSEGDAQGVSVVKINLITAPTEYALENARPVLDELFNVHVVPSAEDRSGPRAGDAFVRDSVEGNKFAGFTLLHVATLGALWVGVPKGGYDLVSKGTWEGDSVYVSRVFASAILTDGLIRRACARVLESVADPKSGLGDLGVGLNIEGTFPIQDAETDPWVNFMVEKTFGFDSNILTYKPAERAPEVDQVRFGVLQQLGEFFSFSFAKLLRIPFYAWLWLRQKIAHLFNKIFQRGDQGASQVVAPEEGADPLDMTVFQRYEEVFEAKSHADKAIASPVGKSSIRSTPNLWESIRKLVFGFLDGSNLSQFGVSRAENGWPVFYKVESIFQDPIDVYRVTNSDSQEGPEFGWGDIRKAESFSSELAERKMLLEGQLNSEIEAIVAANRRIEEINELLNASGQNSVLEK